ncbi:trypsin-like peptidase domain-containing protein [Streptomyces fructofermentans]|uniref:trypsin-like peptidase domain-containing protein n=1 Tax=Streptomyces fructofermentans TaxID=152141 RepID=UPI0037A83356
MTGSGRVRRAWEEQRAAAGRRYRQAGDERSAVRERRAAGMRFPDSPEAVDTRASRLMARGGVSEAIVAGVYSEALTKRRANERIIGIGNESQPWAFLPRGARAASSIARISVRHNGVDMPLGTGFMVSPRLLMTNQHVLEDEAFARRCFVEFNVQNTVENTPDAAIRFALEPAVFFAADGELDFAVVAVAPAVDGRAAGDMFGWQRLSAQTGKAVVGEPVNVIGHPDGRFKEVVVRDNALELRLDDFLHYRTDTAPGSSGSPVFNDQWEVVALHHCGVAKEDEHGNALRKDGRIAQPDDPDHLVDYVSNEGARISSVLRRLGAGEFDEGRRALLAEMGPESGLAVGSSFPPGASGALSTVGTASASGTPAPVVGPGAAGVVGASPDGLLSRPSTAVDGRRETAGAFPGLRGRAIGTRSHLVFLHGRRQHDDALEDLRVHWTAGLNHGLTLAGLGTVEPATVWFPYYARLLMSALGQESAAGRRHFGDPSDPAAAEELDAGPEDTSYGRLVMAAAEARGLPPEDRAATEGARDLLSGGVKRALGFLADVTDLDALVIAGVFRDVDAYLTAPGVRDTVLDGVLKVLGEVPEGENIVLVAHSLGTVVGMDLVHRLPNDTNLSLLVTAGSPLGMDAVYDNLVVTGPDRRGPVTDWANTWSPADPVATGCPLPSAVWGPVTDLRVLNARGRAHKIEEYLAHPEVAGRIGRALRPTGQEP